MALPRSLCGDRHGCTTQVDGTVGTVMDWQGFSTCGGCIFRAIKILALMGLDMKDYL